MRFSHVMFYINITCRTNYIKFIVLYLNSYDSLYAKRLSNKMTYFIIFKYDKIINPEKSCSYFSFGLTL